MNDRDSTIRNQTSPIGIAVVEHLGCYLVGIRGDNGPLPGYAEFPGGKCRPGETPCECAVRECLEETGLAVTAGKLLLNRTFRYPHGHVDLHFWQCHLQQTEDLGRIDNGFRWMPAAELASQKFPEANGPLIELLSRPTRANRTPH